ncbi:hypothetical protein ACWDD9_37520, partial [Kitasatospora sp. NPDC001119]
MLDLLRAWLERLPLLGRTLGRGLALVDGLNAAVRRGPGGARGLAGVLVADRISRRLRTAATAARGIAAGGTDT